MKKILVIDDEKALIEEVGEILTFEGYEVILAENGKDGFNKALHVSPDLILCDVMMPEMDGKRLLYELRGQEKTATTPFIFMSALAERENVRTGMELGADDYLTKPFTTAELLQSVEARLIKQARISKSTKDELEQLRTRVITTLPHEMRTPLTSIIGNSSLLAEMAPALSDTDVTDIGVELLKAGNSLHRLIENYLIMVQLQLNEQANRTTTNANEIESIIMDTARQLGRKYQREDEVEIIISTTIKLNLADSFLRKIIWEIIDNAYKFSPAGTVIHITARQKEQHYYISIADEGRGMTSDEISGIGSFMQFNRDKYEQQGSGLGLAIVQKMAELSDVTIHIESEVNKGTTVTFRIAVA